MTENRGMNAKYLEAGEDQILQEDLELIANGFLGLDSLRNGTFLITGATGLIGSLLAKALICCNRIHKLNIKIIAVIRDMKKAEKIFYHCLNCSEFSFYVVDLETEELSVQQDVDYIVHAASVTSSKVMVTRPVETIKTSLFGTNAILELARLKKVKKMIYISSMEAYGQFQQNETYVDEMDLGYLDLSSVRSCYPEGKRMCEVLCNAYASEYNVNVVSARLAQTFGAGVPLEESRIFAQIARSVIYSQNIVLHTNGESDGNYCYSRDVLTAIIMLLLKGEKGEIYNISNEEAHTTIKDMAMMVAEKVAHNRIQVVFDVVTDNSKLGYAPITKMKLNASKMRQLGWIPEVDLAESYKRMIQSMQNQIDSTNDKGKESI